MAAVTGYRRWLVELSALVNLGIWYAKASRLDRAVADFALTYADQNQRDYEVFTSAIASGRLPAETE